MVDTKIVMGCGGRGDGGEEVAMWFHLALVFVLILLYGFDFLLLFWEYAIS